jgi:hypothetical protein
VLEEGKARKGKDSERRERIGKGGKTNRQTHKSKDIQTLNS